MATALSGGFGGLGMAEATGETAVADPVAAGTVVSGTVRLRLDEKPVPGAEVRLTATDGSGSWASITDRAGRYAVELSAHTAVEGPVAATPTLQMGLPYPNPFNPTTLIPLEVDDGRRLRLTVFGVLGQPVRTLVDEGLEPGRYQVAWDGRDDGGRPVAAGVYLLRLSGPGRALSGKVTLVDGVVGSQRPGANAIPLPAPLLAPEGDGPAYDLQVSGEALKLLLLEGVRPGSATFVADLWAEAETLEWSLPDGGTVDLRGVPAGPFTMGSELFDDERPMRQVHLSAYHLQKHETTLAQYRACVAAGACPPAATGSGCNWGRLGGELPEGGLSDAGGGDRDEHPINCISARDAERYCAWAGLRLPTEAEWEKAARGSGGRLYPWGDEPPGGAGDCDRAVMMRAGLGLGCGYGGTGPVGSRSSGTSPYGVEDMAGNVWEWTADRYDPTYYGRAPSSDPANRGAGAYRSLRGNSWYYSDPNSDLRAANRYRLQPLCWNPFTGVRCARSRAVPLEPGQATGGSEPGVRTASETGNGAAVEARALALDDWMARNGEARAAEGDVLPQELPRRAGEMVVVPAGIFTMGSATGESDEAPVRGVHLDAYLMDRYEVTVAAYEICVAAGACAAPHTDSAVYSLDFEPHYLNGGGPDGGRQNGGQLNGGQHDGDRPARQHHPVNGVSWHDAAAYCAWTGKRLPTEAEWEKAARGPDGRTYPWGEADPDCDRIVMDDGGDGCGHEMAWPVGSKTAGDSPYGVGDLSGNLWEWVDDWYEHGYYRRAPDRNPRNGDPGEGLKVLRGGSMADQNGHIHRAANRLGYDPAQRYDYTIGFRCAKTSQ